MTGTIADVIKAELRAELQPGVEFLRRDRYAERLKTLTGGASVVLAPDVVGGYVKDNTFVPIREAESSFDIKYNLRTFFAK